MDEQMSKDALVPIEPANVPAAANPLDIAPAVFREALSRRGENRKSLIEWVRASLVDGVDYGAIPLRRGGFSKPSLRKPGAEKICGMLGVTATFPTLSQYEQAALEGRPMETVIIRCHLISPHGEIVADGIGARSLAADHGDMNKALKMALKSAQIDATLRMAGLSEIFTQDLEDMAGPGGVLDHHEAPELPAQPQRPPSQGATPPPAAPAVGGGAAAAGGSGRLASERQVKLVRFRLDEAGLEESALCAKFAVPSIEQLPFNKVNEALAWIAGAP